VEGILVQLDAEAVNSLERDSLCVGRESYVSPLLFRVSRLYNALMMKTRVYATVLGALLTVGAVALAQAPKKNISAARHPNLAAAQTACQRAYEKIVAAQQANEWDMQGHAQKAKDLLEQADNELKEAAQAANRGKK
jgi:hypothetical protein